MERAVETNQKHLIKKILARYPTQWTFFRELIQNSDDAQAKQVIIDFYTAESNGSSKVSRTVVANDGNVFSQADWNRLCSIASGNPDPNKVGFFGVGFYSVFALSDMPTVESGAVRLDFFWKGNALFTRETERKEFDEWTRFFLPVVSEEEEGGGALPDFAEIGQFLCELLCFSRNLRTVRVRCNGTLKVTAKRDDLQLDTDQIAFPQQQQEQQSSMSSFITSAVATLSSNSNGASHIQFLPSSQAPTTVSKTIISLSTTLGADITTSSISFIRAAAKFQSRISDSYARQYLDMTQKQHPKQVDLSILLSLDRTSGGSKKQALDRINPSECRGRVFVGFITSQSTGMGVHMSGPFIPTMEREHLDFSNEMAKQFNLALFRSVGQLARLVHDQICAHPNQFVPLTASALPPPVAPPVQEQESFWGTLRKATQVVYSAIVSGDASAQSEDDALFSSLEKNTGAVVIAAMASFCPVETECRPYSGVLAAVWMGFVDKEMFALQGGPLVWTCHGKAMSCDKARLFPPQSSNLLPPLASIETFPVVASQLSRPVMNAASRSVSALVSRFLHELVSSRLLFYFELGDIVSELKTRPLRGLDETAGVLAWFVADDDASNRKISITCANCSANFSVSVTAQVVKCPACYCQLSLPAHLKSKSTSSPNQAMKLALWQNARCDLAQGSKFAFKDWRYFIAGKDMEEHYALVLESIPSMQQSLCPLEISTQCKLPKSLVAELTRELWIETFFQQAPPVEARQQTAFKILYKACYQCKTFDVELLKRLACIPVVPNNAQQFALPNQVYTTEIEEEPDALVLQKLPSFITSLGAEREAKFMTWLQSLGVRESVSPLAMVKLFIKGTLSRVALWRFIHNLLNEKKLLLEPEVIDLLRKIKCVARVGGSKDDELFIPTQLLLPSPSVLELSHVVPVLMLDEPALGPWFAKELKLQSTPTNDVLFRIAGCSANSELKLDAKTRLKALSLLYANNSASAFTLLSTSKLPILPCTDKSWKPPSQCFIKVPEHLSSFCATCDVALLKTEAGITNAKEQLGVAEFPPIKLSIDHLERSPNGTTSVFDYLVAMQQHITDEEFTRLQKLFLIAIPEQCVLYNETNKFQVAPQCYFENKDEDNSALATMFCFVSERDWKKTPQHKHFYHRLGVRPAPTLSEVAHAIATRPARTLQNIGPVEYQHLLRLIASEMPKVKKEVLEAMAKSACLLGITMDDAPPNQGLGLYAASDIVIEDDSRYRRLFPTVPSCPSSGDDAVLERLYAQLGSKNISALIEETSRPTITTAFLPLSTAAKLLDEQLCTRLPILTQRLPTLNVNTANVDSWNKRAKQKRIAKDFGKSETSLVRQVEGIHCELKLKLNNKSLQIKQMKTTCCVYQDRICVTSVDYFHVAFALVGVLLKTRSKDHAVTWASLLQASDVSLEQDMGFKLPQDPIAVPPPQVSRMALREEDDKVVAAPKPVQAFPPASLPPPPSKPSNVAPLPLPPPPSKPSDVAPLPLPPPLETPKMPTNIPPPAAAASKLPLPAPLKRPPPPSPSTTELVASPPNINKFRDGAIDKALQKCRSCDSSQIKDNGRQVPLHDAMVDCTQPHDLVRDEQGIGSLECFIPRELAHRYSGVAGDKASSPFQIYIQQGREFANLLVQMCTEVFQLDPNVLHLFFDPRGITRAFNLGGALFFNLFCFVHDGDSLRSPKSWKRWFGTFCHELSHNCWGPHDAQFANFVEVFCVEFSHSLHTSMTLRGLLM